MPVVSRLHLVRLCPSLKLPPLCCPVLSPCILGRLDLANTGGNWFFFFLIPLLKYSFPSSTTPFSGLVSHSLDRHPVYLTSDSSLSFLFLVMQIRSSSPEVFSFPRFSTTFFPLLLWLMFCRSLPEPGTFFRHNCLIFLFWRFSSPVSF